MSVCVLPPSNQYFQAKTKENIMKTSIFNQKPKNTKGKPIFSSKNQRKPKENQYFEAKTKEHLRRTKTFSQNAVKTQWKTQKTKKNKKTNLFAIYPGLPCLGVDRLRKDCFVFCFFLFFLRFFWFLLFGFGVLAPPPASRLQSWGFGLANGSASQDANLGT